MTKDEKKKIMFDYFGMTLRSFLQEHDDPRCDNVNFITERADAAAAEAESLRLEGFSVFDAQECAMNVLFSGIV